VGLPEPDSLKGTYPPPPGPRFVVDPLQILQIGGAPAKQHCTVPEPKP